MDVNKKKFIIQNFYNYIKTSLDYKDESSKKDIVLNNNIYRFEEKKENTIVYYNINNEIILKIKYQIIGVFDRKQILFNWGWSISNIDSKYLFYSNKLLEYGLKLSQENIIMKLLLTKSEIKFANLLFEDFISAIVTCLLKKKTFLIALDDSRLHCISLICQE